MFIAEPSLSWKFVERENEGLFLESYLLLWVRKKINTILAMELEKIN